MDRSKPRRCVAIQRHVSRAAGELDFQEGDKILVLEELAGGWLRGQFKGQTGLFKKSYVKEEAHPAKKRSLTGKVPKGAVNNAGKHSLLSTPSISTSLAYKMPTDEKEDRERERGEREPRDRDREREDEGRYQERETKLPAAAPPPRQQQQQPQQPSPQPHLEADRGVLGRVPLELAEWMQGAIAEAEYSTTMHFSIIVAKDAAGVLTYNKSVLSARLQTDPESQALSPRYPQAAQPPQQPVESPQPQQQQQPPQPIVPQQPQPQQPPQTPAAPAPVEAPRASPPPPESQEAPPQPPQQQQHHRMELIGTSKTRGMEASAVVDRVPQPQQPPQPQPTSGEGEYDDRNRVTLIGTRRTEPKREDDAGRPMPAAEPPPPAFNLDLSAAQQINSLKMSTTDAPAVLLADGQKPRRGSTTFRKHRMEEWVKKKKENMQPDVAAETGGAKVMEDEEEYYPESASQDQQGVNRQGRSSSFHFESSTPGDEEVEHPPTGLILFDDTKQFNRFVKSLINPETGLKVVERKSGLRNYKKCFVGDEAVDWLVYNLSLQNRQDAVYIGNLLMSRGVIEHINHSQDFQDKHIFYRFWFNNSK